MDPSDDMCSRSVDPSSSSGSRESPGVEDGVLKSCTDCRTTKTPLWRGGPEGPKTLCNACGIRYRKKRREALGLPPEPRKEKKISGVSLKIQMLGLGQNHQVVLKQQKHHYHHQHHHYNHSEQHGYSWTQKQRRGRRRIGEVEQAAVLLMAMSSGLFYA